MEKQILKEEEITTELPKEDLPMDFVTSFVSKSWDEVGVLKASIEAISKDFNNTEKVVSVLQDLADAYLVCIGQLELFLHKNDYLTKEVIAEPEIAAPIEEPVIVAPEAPIVSEVPVTIETQPLTESTEEKADFEPFEYFCDFE